MVGRPRVLVVDDEMGVRESLRALLEAECEVLTASTGEEALALLEREPVEAMTLDLKLPGLAGIRVLERARQLDPDLEVLIITGYGSLDTAVQGLRFRALDYLSKPFDCDQVRRLVHVALARRAATRRLKAAPEQLLSTLSHEFRTPLNVILGYSSMLREESAERLSDEERQALDRIQANSTSLLGYLEGLFYLAELDRGLVPVAAGPLRVATLLERLGAELGPRAHAKGLGWRMEAPDDLVVVTDEDKLARLVRALGDNAIRYTSAGEIALVARAGTPAVTVEIRDTGPGLRPEVVAEAEDLAVGRLATEPPRLLGLGLRLAGRLVRALGATFTVATGPAGTACLLRLPDLVPEAAAPPHRATA